jgi:hypothetical protein
VAHWLDMVITLVQSDASDLRSLCQIAGGDPKTFYRGTDLSRLDLSEADREFLHTEAISNAVKQLRGAGRQEERVAIILSQLLQDRDVGILALREIATDRAEFAKTAFALIRNQFRLDDHNNSNDELVVADLVQKLNRSVFPYNRGQLLYYLAKHLRKYPKINSTIQNCMKRSVSMAVEEVRTDVEKLLSNLEDAT